MEIKIRDDFNLTKIINSGQCFRGVELKKNLYRFIMNEEIIYIEKKDEETYKLSCNEKTWKKTWKHYFDMERNYSKIRNTIPKNDTFLINAAKSGKGIRILKQDAWEMLITFITSQRKSIPAIRTAIEKLCKLSGNKKETKYETIYTFPTIEQLGQLTIQELETCGLGYRAPYIYKTTKTIQNGKIDLKEISTYDDQKLIETLKTLSGVGIKVANCVALFAYNRVSLAPIDVWIDRIIQNEYKGKNPFPAYGKTAGIMQQYMFYHMQVNKNKKM